MAGVFNSYHTGSVQYGSEEAEPVAGHLIGSATGVDVNGKSLGNLYYQEVGILPAIGNYDAGDYATAMPLTAMQAQEFVDKLNGYANISLYGVTWTQGDSESQNLPVCGSFETLERLRLRPDGPDRQRQRGSVGQERQLLLCAAL